MTKKDQSLQSIVELLKREFKPSRLFLFGSRAAKTAGSESDFDFVMVLPKYSGDRMLTWEKCNELIRKECGVLADVFTYSENEFKKLKDEFSSIPETAVSTGREIDIGSV
jgi:DNA polymerase sigma